MLRRLTRRLTYANVVATLALAVALGTGGAYAANTIRSSDIVDGEVGSADVKDNSINTFDVHSFLGEDIVDQTITGADIKIGTINAAHLAQGSVGSYAVANGSLTGEDIQDRSLVDDDLGLSAHNFEATIGTIASHVCERRDITGANAATNHLILTPASDADPGIDYKLEYLGQDTARLIVCNFTDLPIFDGTTHFNLLVIDAG